MVASLAVEYRQGMSSAYPEVPVERAKGVVSIGRV
jgi:hypothetical protein